MQTKNVGKLSAMAVTSVALILCMFVSGCAKKPPDQNEAEKFGAEFMSDLIANRLDQADRKLDPQILKAAGDRGANKVFEDLVFRRCGRPLSFDLVGDETGGSVSTTSGRTRGVRVLRYNVSTTDAPNGGCLYVVTIAASQNGDLIVKFVGAGKRTPK